VSIPTINGDYELTFTVGDSTYTHRFNVTAGTPPQPPDPAITVAASAELGGVLHLSGVGFTHPDGSGSTIAVKIDDGAYSHISGEGPNANLSVWAIVQAAADGTFEADITLPDGTGEGANGSTPAFTTGSHTLRLLTGSLKAGDTIRTVASDSFTVTPPAGTPTVTVTPSVELGGVLHVSGTNFTHPTDTEAGSLIALKLDGGAYAHTAGNGVDANLTVWALVQAAADGSFEYDLTLPDGTTEGANGSVPAFPVGDHSMNFLSGTMKQGDTIRSLAADFTVTAASTPPPVGTAPAITTQPLSQSVTVGTAVSFNAAASGDPTPSVQWYVKAAGQSTFADVPDATSATLELGAVTLAQSGSEYKVTFTNDNGIATSEVATLTVIEESTPPPADETTVTVTTEATLGGTVQITGTGWAHPDGTGSVVAVKIDDGAYSHTTGNGPNANLSVWAIIEANDDGTFEADVTLPDGTEAGAAGSTPAFATGEHTLRFLSGSLKTGDVIRTLQSVVITVTDGSTPPPTGTVPVITTQPVSQTVTAGATATFIAAATGNPAPSVKWQYYTGAIWADIVNATSPTLSVTNANVTFSGRQYRAVFTNSEGTATSDVVTLTVTEGTTPPPIGDAAVTIGATASVGGSIHISGTGFTHPDGTGSTVAIKINEGAFSRTAEGKVNDNLSVWAIVNANADGSFEYDLVLPDGTEAGAGGSTPAFREGEYTLRFLTGSLKAGDTIRTVQSTPFIVGQYRPVGDPTPIDPSASLTGALSDLISISITGNQAVITIPSAEPGDWVHLSAYLGSSVRYPWGAGANFVVDTNRQVRVTLAAGAFEESGTYSVVVRDVSQGAGAAVLGWASYLVPDPDDGSGNDGDGSGNGSGNGSGGDSIVNNYYNTTNSGGGGSTASTTTTTPSTGTTTTGTGTGTSATTGTNATTGTGTGSGSTTGTGSSTGTSSGSNAGSSNLSDQATPLADGTTAAEDSFTLLLNIILIAAAALVAAIAVAACILVYRSRRPSAGN
jgi:hypothetical protein